MKRMYIKPEISVVTVEVSTAILNTSGGGTESGGAIVPGDAVPAANSQRDGWGNLWGDDK